MVNHIQEILDNYDTVEFGIGRDQDQGRSFFYVPPNDDVQKDLIEIAKNTLNKMTNQKSSPRLYEPAETYTSYEFLYLPMSHELSSYMYKLHNSVNLDQDNLSNNINNILFYFVKIIDKNKNKVTFLRRAYQFKSITSQRILQFYKDSIRRVEEPIFKLDNEFDIAMDDDHIYILRPSGFEFAGQLKEAILNAVPQNINILSNKLSFINFDNIEKYAKKRPRAARYLASIKSQEEIENINPENLKVHCKNTGVFFNENEEKIYVDDKNIMGFLEVLDRRRYELELIDGQPEQFRASKRDRIKSQDNN